MSVVLTAQNKTKMSFFLCTNFLPFCGHNQKNSSWDIARNSYQDLALDPLGGLQCPLRYPTICKSATRSSRCSFE